MSNVSLIPLENALETELENSVTSVATDMTLSTMPSYDLLAGEKVPGVIDPKNNFREGFYHIGPYTAGTDTTITIERGKPDYEGGPSTASTHSGGATVVLSDNWQTFSEAATAINTKLDNDGGNATTSFDLDVSGSDFRIRLDGGDMKLTDDNQAEVSLSTLAAAAGVDDKMKNSNTDTTSGYNEDKTDYVAGANVSISETTLNPGGNEVREVTVAADSKHTGVTEHLVYTPGYLTGDTGAESAWNNWVVITDASFRITIDGAAYNVDAIDFTGVTSMADVATYIQTALNTATGGTETVAWSTDHFVITSTNTTVASEISVTSTSTGTVGTDISGAGGSDWMDADVGNGTVTTAIVDGSADAGKVILLNSGGKVHRGFSEGLSKTYLDYPYQVDTLVDDVTSADGVMYPYNENSIYDSIIDNALEDIGLTGRKNYTLNTGEENSRCISEPFKTFNKINNLKTSTYKFGAISNGTWIVLDGTATNAAAAIQEGKMLAGADENLLLYEVDETDGELTELDSIAFSGASGGKIWGISQTFIRNVFIVLYYDGTDIKVMAVNIENGVIDEDFDTGITVSAGTSWSYVGRGLCLDTETILFPTRVDSSGASITDLGITKITYSAFTGKVSSSVNSSVDMGFSGNDEYQCDLDLLEDDKVIFVAGLREVASRAFKTAVYTPSTNTMSAPTTISATEVYCAVRMIDSTHADALGMDSSGNMKHYLLTISGGSVSAGVATTVSSSNAIANIFMERRAKNEYIVFYDDVGNNGYSAYLNTSGTPSLSGATTLNATGSIMKNSLAFFGPHFYSLYSSGSQTIIRPVSFAKDVTGTANISIKVNDNIIETLTAYGLDVTTTLDYNVEEDSKIDLVVTNNVSDSVVVELLETNCDSL